MNIIKKVMVFVMGVVVIGIASTTIAVVTRPTTVNKSLTFELLDDNKLSYNVYDKINEYAIIDENDDVTNLVSATVNGDDVFTIPYFYHDAVSSTYTLTDEITDMPQLEIIDPGYYTPQLVNIGDIITLTFSVEVKTPIFVNTLILLIPLVLSASLIGYLAIKVGDEQ